MRKTVLAAMALLPVISVQNACSQNSDAGRLRDEIETHLSQAGADPTLKKYFGCGYGPADPPGPGYALVTTGEAEAVDLAARLIPASDGCVAFMLNSSLGTAMQTNPEAVLSLAHRYPALWDPSRLCVPQMIEKPADEVFEVLDRSEQAISGVNRSDLRDAAQECLSLIADYRARVEAQANAPR